MKIPFILHWKNITLSFLCMCCILLILVISGCGEDYSSSDADYDLSNTGAYACSLKWPDDVPTLETSLRVSTKIDCNAAGVATVAATFYDGGGSYLTGDEWSCSLGKGTVYGIPAGSNRRLVVTGEDASGTVLYRGEETGIEIVAGQTAQGGVIEMERIYGWAMLKLPDTGQTQSYTDTFGEDSDYTINPPSYTDNGNSTVTDNVTGLMWQQEDDDTTRTWDEACSYCNDLALGGYSDWRLPSKKELMSIVDYSIYSPAIDTTYFPGTNASLYWSSTPYSSFSRWFVYFGYGRVGYGYGKSLSGYVRCVRGGQ